MSVHAVRNRGRHVDAGDREVGSHWQEHDGLVCGLKPRRCAMAAISSSGEWMKSDVLKVCCCVQTETQAFNPIPLTPVVPGHP